MSPITRNLGLINHVAILLDASSSMQGRQRDVISVVDGLVKWLSTRSQDLDQETRVSVYTFASHDDIKCVVFDKDVMRLPSIKDLYQVYGNTALRDCLGLSIDDLSKTAQMYGDHAFLLWVVTDGAENNSRTINAYDLASKLNRLPDNWTVAALVPDSRGKIAAEDCGIPRGNIEIWDVNSVTGIAEVGDKVEKATDNYMVARSTGLTGSKTLFAQQVTQAQVQASGMKPLDTDRFVIVPVVATGDMTYVIPKRTVLRSRPDGIKHVEIMAMVKSTGQRFVAGKAFYELTKAEKYEFHKDVALIHTDTKEVFIGKEAKALIGIQGSSTRIRPLPKDKLTGKPEYDVFIQSQSTNRLLPVGSRILLLK